MKSYTKGWIIEEDEDSCMGAIFIGQDRGDGHISDPICRVTDLDAALLIAAAPELLEALELADEYRGMVPADVADKIESAIAKAKS